MSLFFMSAAHAVGPLGEVTYPPPDPLWGGENGIILDTPTYDAFGVMFEDGGGSVAYYYRHDARHVSSSDAVMARIRYDAGSWGSPASVFSDPTYGVSGVAGGVVGDSLHMFFALVDNSGNMQQLARVKSSDGLAGNAWEAKSLISTTYERYEAYGRTVEANGVYLQSWFEHLDGGSDPWRVNVLRSTDSGATWSNVNLYDGMLQYSETALAHIGLGRVVALSRDNAGGVMVQSVSSDNGATWSAFSASNLGGVGVNNASIEIEGGKLIVFYMDRTGGKMKMSVSDANTVFSDPTAYESPVDVGVIPNGFVGYPSSSITSEGVHLLFSDEKSISDADIHGGLISRVVV